MKGKIAEEVDEELEEEARENVGAGIERLLSWQVAKVIRGSGTYSEGDFLETVLANWHSIYCELLQKRR